MKSYHFTVMSIDPNEDPDDNSQKYGITVSGKNQEDAEKNVEGEFHNEYGSHLPIYWIKCNGES